MNTNPLNIKRITVVSARTIPHPSQTFANLRPEIRLTAEISEGDEARLCARWLQEFAEQLLDEHLVQIQQRHQQATASANNAADDLPF